MAIGDGVPTAAIVNIGAEFKPERTELVAALSWACGSRHTSAAVPQHVAVWLSSIEPEEARSIVEAWRQANEKPTSDRSVSTQKRRPYRGTKLSYRLAIGKAIDVWLHTPEGRDAKQCGKQWAGAALALGLDGRPGRRLVQRSHAQWIQSPARHGLPVPSVGGHSMPAWLQVPHQFRLRARGAQGRPALTEIVGSMLYQWFVDHRMTVFGRVSSRSLLQTARSLLLACSVACVADGTLPEPPHLSRKWLSRWRHSWGVSLRKPSKRYKVRKAVLKARLKVYWSNLLALRFFFLKVFGIEPVQEQYDQKGVHYNESGSKQTSTYEMPGRTDIPIKENHAQTRLRVSWMTCTFSDLKRAGRPLPLEQLFKASGTRVLRDLVVPDEKRYTFQTSPSGSYRHDHVFEFMKKHLLPWSKERAATKDYRVLSLDAYSAHKGPELEALAWSRGYVYHPGLMVPGGATGIVQGPDTDLHAWLEAELISLQDLETSARLLERPHRTPNESRQSMSDYATSLWEVCDHSQGERSFKRNGLTNALSGSEDALITRSARELWIELNMASIRVQIEAEVDLFLQDRHDVKPEDVFDLLQTYDSCPGGAGICNEGQEIEPRLGKSEKPWLLDGELEEFSDDSFMGEADSDEEVPLPQAVLHAELEPCLPDGDSVPVLGSTHASSDSVLGLMPAHEKVDLVVSDLRILGSLIAMAKHMKDKTTLVSLEAQQERMLRLVRRGNAGDRQVGQKFLDACARGVREMQAGARLEDRAKREFKHKRLVDEAVRKATARKRKELILPSLPASAPASALAGDCVPVVAGDCVLVAGGVDDIKAKYTAVEDHKTDEKTKVDKEHKDEMDKGHTKHTKHKKKKHKKHAGSVAMHKVKEIFSVEVDTEVKLRSVITRLAEGWKHKLREPVLAWLARAIRTEANDLRKGVRHPAATRFFRKGELPKSHAPGMHELVVARRLRDLSNTGRMVFFDRSATTMTAVESEAK